MRFATLTIIKDEHRYLKEWIEYNLSIGFTDIILYEDIGSKSHSEICSFYPQVELHSIKEVPDYSYNSTYGRARQYNLYKWALNEYVGKYDWCAFIDVDEFIRFESGFDLYSLTSLYKDKQGVFLYWNNKGANGEIFYKDEPVQKRFSSSAIISHKDTNPGKTIVNLNVDTDFKDNIHLMVDSFDTNMNRSVENKITYNKAWIDHYFTKSWEEWCLRWKRGERRFGDREIEDFFEINEDMLSEREKLIDIKYKILNYGTIG